MVTGVVANGVAAVEGSGLVGLLLSSVAVFEEVADFSLEEESKEPVEEPEELVPVVRAVVGVEVVISPVVVVDDEDKEEELVVAAAAIAVVVGVEVVVPVELVEEVVVAAPATGVVVVVRPVVVRPVVVGPVVVVPVPVLVPDVIMYVESCVITTPATLVIVMVFVPISASARDFDIHARKHQSAKSCIVIS